MVLRRATPLTFSPHGLSDAIDGTNVFQGAMASLQNLIPDPQTANTWQCRPAAIKIVDFNGGASSSGPFSSGFSSGFQSSFSSFTASFISALEVFGTRAYGMVATTRNPGNDEPFVYDLVTKAFIPVSGVTAANTPASPSATGAWTPPSIALVGTKVVVTHPGFNFGGGFAIGFIDISNPAAPAWSAGNTATNALPAIPTWVANLNGRAYYLVNPPTGQPGAYFSDVLVPGTITNASQVLTFDDNVPLTCAAGLGLFNQLGGIIQSLMVFKGDANIYQVTGDAGSGGPSTASTLAKNSLNVATGTLSPLSVTTTPKGLAFLAPDGLRIIDFTAKISDPIGVDGGGVNAPFIYNVVPSRVQAASNQNVLRISVQNGLAPGAPNQEFWFDISRKKWSGPHTFPASMIAPYGNTFIMTPVGVLASLWQSDVAQSATSTFTENNQPMTYMWTTCMLPDSQQMAAYVVIESSIKLQIAGGQMPISVAALDQNFSVLGSIIVVTSSGATLWGQFKWGQATWGGAQSNFSFRALPWLTPIVFSQLQIQLTGRSIGGMKIGDLNLRYQQLGYIQTQINALAHA